MPSPRLTLPGPTASALRSSNGVFEDDRCRTIHSSTRRRCLFSENFFACALRKRISRVPAMRSRSDIMSPPARRDDAGHPRPGRRRPLPDRAARRVGLGAIPGQRQRCPPAMGIREIAGQAAPDVAFADNCYLIQAFPPSAADQALRIGMLPGTPRRGVLARCPHSSRAAESTRHTHHPGPGGDTAGPCPKEKPRRGAAPPPGRSEARSR